MSQVYGVVATAESSGGDVSALISRLNQAEALVRAGDSDSLARATSIVADVGVAAEAALSAGRQSMTFRYVSIAATLVVLGIVGVLVYFYGSKLFLTLQLRSNRSNGELERRRSLEKEFKIVSFALIGLLSVITVYPMLSAGWMTEPFSELGVMGPSGKLGDYPSQVAVNEEFSLLVYVGDHEGHSGYYRVSLKLGDQNSDVSDTKPLDVTPIDYWNVFLLKGGSFTQPVTLSMFRAGPDQCIVFELSMFEPKTNTFVYKSWIQLWINVIANE